MMYMNAASSSSGSYSEMFSGSSLLPHNYGESVGDQDEAKYISAIGDTTSMQSIDGHSNSARGVLVSNTITGDSHGVPSTQLKRSDGEQNIQCQGLSLSLGTQMDSALCMHRFQYQYPHSGVSSFLGNCLPIQERGTISHLSHEVDENNLHKEFRSDEFMPSEISGGYHHTMRTEAFYNPHSPVYPKEVHSDPCLHGSPDFGNTVLNTKYLKAAQLLLDEMVSVRKVLKQTGSEKHKNYHEIGVDGSKDPEGKPNSQPDQMPLDPSFSTANSSCELSSAERQNLLEKKTKLLSTLDEVDRRYRRYCQQMQIVVSSLDMVAGCGAAEPYTALALRSISCHFRCLRDAIANQIQVTQRSLGEQEGIPRLRYVDQQLRQQRTIQQLGVMRQAWRPQRGLPESSVSILRAWLFEHFLHPYPKDSEKIMLARQTGLTRNQVANWFINARVRLWKPMVEEMYKEEFGDSDLTCKFLPENGQKAERDNIQGSEDRKEEFQDNVLTTTAHKVQPGLFHDSKSDHTSTIKRNDPATGIGYHSSDQRSHMNDNSIYAGEITPHDQNGGSNLMTSASATYNLLELGSFAMGGPHVTCIRVTEQ
ncbi:BEL1-like homeodomain protein 7 [Quillaja saponaria]|uniref:BEL1-like homeodomain protein 7 n=1 Tax=Quillaja saponaria TaxID=32244 RepID=A0AAD7LGZ4_QUISA|nr:BEL1-like homeodomain protein 7 [Quillaja saponaria]